MKIDWLTLDDARTDPAAKAVFDAAVAQVNDGTATVQRLNERGLTGFIVDGQKVPDTALLEYAFAIPAAEFDHEAARAFTERLRQLLGWNRIDYTLHQWVERRLRDPFFENRGSEWNSDWQLLPEADASHLPESFLRFACYIAIGDLKYGPSYASVSAERIFDWVTKLGSDLPARLKKHGTGELPADLVQFQADGVTVKANDALAVVRIVVKEETQAAYEAALGHLVRLLTETDFPRSYSIEFRGPTKTYLPIKGLPKKGVNQLFACAAGYPELWPLIERYARAAIREFEWYTNLEDENCAMPGSFAVFALGLADAGYAPLVLDYLHEADGEHQSLHARFLEAHLDAHGFTPEAIAYLLATAGNIQHLPHRKTYPAMIANRASLEALIAARAASGERPASSISALQANLAGEPVPDHAWRHARYTIWGEPAERDRGQRVIATAPAELRPLYQEIFS